MNITLLHIDDCPSWVEAESRLSTALAGADMPGTPVKVVTVMNAAHAVALNFAGSPTILIDGVDLFPDGARASDLACRIYRTPNGLAGLPTVEQVVDALARRHRP
ncbi:thioredoxin family protein [Salinibacterium sp.]|uniref:thioredoxin family protein n=1 Tax=Salinibacterium sp. TaxID=1915057 RepID=UPI00286BF390|nr:thioredoxin family protein [Salinibacterium sp.]